MVREVYLYVRSGVRRGRDRHGLGARKEHVREWSSQRFCARLLLETKSLLLCSPAAKEGVTNVGVLFWS